MGIDFFPFDSTDRIMTGTLIRQVQIDGVEQDILIKGNRIAKIAKDIRIEGFVNRIEGKGLTAVPGMANLHTHAAMTLFRGYGDDLPLFTWLNDYIWPVEAHLTEEDVYWGVRLACLEMARTGTTCFLDMYSFPLATAQAVEDSGLRGVISYTLFDRGDKKRAEEDRRCCYDYLKAFQRFSSRVSYSIGPHAIYTVSGEQLRFCRDFADETGVLVHLHLSETQKEIDDALTEYGKRPALYLESLGALSDKFVLAHSLYLSDEELQVIASSGAACVHNPASNMKLASGQGFRFEEMKKLGIPVGIGTDGCSSSNNLDMFIAMRLAALLGKVSFLDPTVLKSQEIYNAATQDGYKILNIDGGRLEEGALADLCLLRLNTPVMTPCHNLVSNLVYSADGSVVDTTIVDGNTIMLHGKIEGENEVIEAAARCAYNLITNYGIKEK